MRPPARHIKPPEQLEQGWKYMMKRSESLLVSSVWASLIINWVRKGGGGYKRRRTGQEWRLGDEKFKTELSRLRLLLTICTIWILYWNTHSHAFTLITHYTTAKTLTCIKHTTCFQCLTVSNFWKCRFFNTKLWHTLCRVRVQSWYNTWALMALSAVLTHIQTYNQKSVFWPVLTGALKVL